MAHRVQQIRRPPGPEFGFAPPVRDLQSCFLQQLSEPARKEILSAATHRKLAARSIITNQADSAEYFFLLTSGRARHFFTTADGKKSLLLWLRPGDVFGGAALFRFPSRYLVSTEMVEDGTTAVWNRPLIRRLCAQHPTLIDNALMIASDYLSWYTASHTALLYRNAKQRLSNALLSLSEGLGVVVDGGMELRITNEELANVSNLTVFTTSRLLSQWQKKGAIRKTRGAIVLLNSELLSHS
jgi:CRP/FNR family transcriptional regulator, nitrogen oxide reductase regulator